MSTSRLLKRMSAILVTALLSIGFAQAQTISQRGVAEIDSLLDEAVRQNTLPGVVAIVVSGNDILYHHAFGLSDVEHQKAMLQDSIFRIASMTKPLTSAAVLLLREQGTLRLDDPISKYLPEFANREVLADRNSDGTFTTRKAAEEILIRHLLTNTSGLAYGFSNTTVNELQQQTGKQPEQLPLLYDPGTRWTYSPGTKVLGRVIEEISGVSLDRFLDEHFFQPLGMEDTFYAVPENKTERVVTTHRRTAEGLMETPNPASIASPVAGDGGLNSTTADYAKFLQMLLNGGQHQGRSILGKASIQEMTSNQIGNVVVDTQPAALPTVTRPFPVAPGAGRDKFGFGFEITASNEENTNLRASGSYTWAGIYNTHFWVDPQRRIGAVIMMQVLPFYDDAAMKVYQDFEEAVGRNLR